MAQLDNIMKELKEMVPEYVGVAVFSIKDGLLLSEDIKIPDYDPEFTAAVHVENWNSIKKFVEMLPPELTGKVKNVLLEVKAAYFEGEVMGEEDYLLMVGIKNEGNLGMLKAAIRKFKPKIEKVLLK